MKFTVTKLERAFFLRSEGQKIYTPANDAQGKTESLQVATELANHCGDCMICSRPLYLSSVDGSLIEKTATAINPNTCPNLEGVTVEIEQN